MLALSWACLFVLASVACSGDPICPKGTSGTPCKPTGDLGARPEIPSVNKQSEADAVSVDTIQDAVVDALPQQDTTDVLDGSSSEELTSAPDGNVGDDGSIAPEPDADTNIDANAEGDTNADEARMERSIRANRLLRRRNASGDPVRLLG